MEEYLTPGFRFYPTEEELVSFYLHKKLEGTRQDLDLVIPVVYIYEFNPWDLPQFAGELCRKDPEQWFFFIPRQEKEARGGRPNRLTTSGYWKATGSPGFVYSSSGNRIIGMKRTMVFYKGRAHTGRKTEWKMNEYRTITIEGDPSSSSTGTETPEQRQDHEYSLCRVYVKKSKCLRAFDRRPSAVTISNAVGLMVDHHPRSSLLQNYCPNNPGLLTETTTSPSPDQGYWEDHANPNSKTSGSHDNWDLIAFDNNEVLLDWEQLNWF